MWVLAGVALAVLVLNIPFGYWRAGARKFSMPWFLAVHAAVPIVVGLRILSGLGFSLATVSVIVAAYFGGQFVGGRLRPDKRVA